MALRKQESVSGFIASDPQLTYTERGDARFYAKIGQEHDRKEPDGSFTHRDQVFVQFVLDDVAAHRRAEDDFNAGLNPKTGEVA